MSSSNIQLSCIPDKIIVFVRRPVNSLKCSDTDSYLTIKNITVQFNNNVLMPSFSTSQLYRISVDSGLKNLSWDEFSGSVMSVSGAFGNQVTNGEPPVLYNQRFEVHLVTLDQISLVVIILVYKKYQQQGQLWF